MPDAPAVSVIIPTYNWSSVLGFAIRSVLRQTLADFELLVIGDACTDDTEQVVASFGDPRIRWHNRAENFGSQSGPNNTGLEMARGALVAYLGHDDLWYPTHLAALSDAINATGADFAYSLCEWIGPPEKPSRRVTGGPAPRDVVEGWFVPPTSLMHRRAVVDEIGGWRDYRTLDMPPDMEFLARAFRRGKRFVDVPELTAFKFPSALRPESYVKKTTFEQAELLRRMEEEPDFRCRELTAIVSALAAHRQSGGRRWIGFRAWLTVLFSPPGRLVETWRKKRGLPPASAARPGIVHLINRLRGRYNMKSDE